MQIVIEMFHSVVDTQLVTDLTICALHVLNFQVSDVISSDQELFQARESLHRLKDEYQQVNTPLFL